MENIFDPAVVYVLLIVPFMTNSHKLTLENMFLVASQ